MQIETEYLPKVRSNAIISKEADGELLIYDVRCDKAHCLNETAAAIWRLCDGQTSVSEIAMKLDQVETDKRSDADAKSPRVVSALVEVVWMALDQLRRLDLLEEEQDEGQRLWHGAPIPKGISRREAVRRIGLGAAIGLPIITSMTVPTAVEAAVSCFGKCHPCTTSAECCSICVSSSSCPGGGMKCA